jgi:GDP-mannose 6-dehydrogenase
MDIAVIGLGYVGCVSAACLAQMGHNIIGVDVNETKVNMINDGLSPIIEKNLGSIVKDQVATGRLRATRDIDKAVLQSGIVFICVGTPSRANGSLNTEYIERVCAEIGKALARKEDYCTIALRSTVLPGIAESVVIPLLEEYSGKKAGEDFGFALNPEFLREGSSVYDFYHPPKTIIGELDKRSGDTIASIYATIEAPLFRLDLGEAAMVKYADNSFHAVKVAFANEIGRICKLYNIDSRMVMDVFTKDVKLNLSSYYLKPGFAFGGSCLPKDLRAIIHTANQNDVEVPLLKGAIESNVKHIEHALQMVKGDGRKKVGILGLSFKGGTDDLRESPVVAIVEQLIGKGYSVRIFDKNVSLARLMGANKEYIEREIPHIARLMCDSVHEVIRQSDVLVIGNKAHEHEKIFDQVMDGQVVIDFMGLENASNGKLSEVNYEGICW